VCHSTTKHALKVGIMPWTYLPQKINPHHQLRNHTLSGRQLICLRVLLLLSLLLALWLLSFSSVRYLS
jgi:hypothetical protein